MDIKFHVLLFKEQNEDGDWWVAQCLEYDLAAQARTLRDVEYEFQRTAVCYLLACIENEIEPFKDLPPAPAEYWERFDNARRVESEIPLFGLPQEVPPAYMIREQECRVY